MYLWRIESLRHDLAARTVTERMVLPYLLWLGGLTTFAATVPYGDYNTWDLAGAAAATALFLGGTLYAFRSNGGVAGTDFLVRYITLSWVLLLRFLVLLVVPSTIALLWTEELIYGEVPDYTTVVGFLETIVFEFAYYWRLSVHFRLVAESTPAA